MDVLDRAAHNRMVASYYEPTRIPLWRIWSDPKTLSLHHGYWDASTRTDMEAQRNLNRVLAERLQLEGGQRVLDAGCGLGGSAIWLVENYDVHAVGITLSPGQALQASAFARQRGVAHRVKFVVGDYLAMPLADATFDAVWALESSCHALSKHAFLAEAIRVLKPDGKLVVADGFRRNRPYSNGDEALMRRWLEGWGVRDIVTPDELLAFMREVGFMEAEMEDVTERVRPTLRRLYRLSLPGIPAFRLLARMRLLPAHFVGVADGAYLQYRALRRNLSMYGIASARKPEVGKRDVCRP